MLVFRSFAIGLLGACCLLVATRPAPKIVTVSVPVTIPVPAAAPATLVDVASGVPAGALASLVRIAPGERVVSIDGRRVADDLEAGAALAALSAGAGRYTDLIVASATTTRRVLVLRH